MGEQLQIFVRSPGGARFFTWEPLTADTPVAALVESLQAEYPHSQHGPIDLIDESSGKLVGPDVPAQAVADRLLVARTRYVSDAIEQLKALHRQEGAAFAYCHEPGSSTLELEFRSPGLDQVDSLDGNGILVKGHHRALLILPRGFPENQPRILWLSSVFHPNLAPDVEVWPPHYDWANAPTLLGLIRALIETLAGASVQLGRRFSIRRRGELNPRAARWYRRNRRAVAALAACARHDAHAPMDAYPLDSATVDWELQGQLNGSDATVFLSRKAMEGIPEFGARGPAWLIGKKGRHGQADWLYVAYVTSRVQQGSSGAPVDAIGILRGTEESDASSSRDTLPLDAHLRGGDVVLRVASGDLAGYMVEVDGVSSSEQSSPSIQAFGRPITIRGPSVEQADETTDAAEPGAPPEDADGACRLLPRDLEAPICMYCGIVCVRSEDWGACADCGFVMHAECLHQLGGCPNTDCPRSVLEHRSAASP